MIVSNNDKQILLSQEVTTDASTIKYYQRQNICRALIASLFIVITICGGISFVLVYTPTEIDMGDTVLSCYYNTPALKNASEGQLLPSQIDPYLCTHINVAFARIVHKEIYLDQSQVDTIRKVVALKRINPKLKVLLSVGGAGKDNGYSEMIVDHASRKIFIKSLKSILRNFTLDGVDLDWEFPVIHARGVAAPRERQHFSQLLREIRTEYSREKRGYLLTVALAAPEVIVDVAYDVDQINEYVDYANLMTYDYHYYSEFTPFTGLNSPLYARPGESLYLATLNVNYTLHMYAARGLAAARSVLGVPAYGHTFTLVNPANTGVGSPAAGGGFADYPRVCALLAAGASVREAAGAAVPYLFAGAAWVSWDSPASAARKARLARARALRGAMLYSLNADDHAGRCGPRFPLARAVRGALRAAARSVH